MSEKPIFVENASENNKILDNITNTLGCKVEEITEIEPLKAGLTNDSWHFRTSEGEYVYRHPGIGTEQLINRQAEVAAQVLAHEMGIDDTFIYEDPVIGWKISRFLPNCTLLNVHDESQLKEAMQIARSLHESEMKLERTFQFWEESERYEKILLEQGEIQEPDYKKLKENVDQLISYMKDDNAPNCLTHNDFFDLNLLRDVNGKVYLIDWEYAGTGDYANDFGTFVVTSKLSDEEAQQALHFYFDREPSLEELRHNYGMVALAGWCWYLWSLVKEREGDDVGEWLEIYYSYAERYLDKALKLYETAQ